MELKPVKERSAGVRELPSKKWIAVGGVIFLLAALFAFQKWYEPQNPKPVVETFKVNKQDMSVGLTAAGTLQAAKQQDVYAKGTSVVKQIKKEVGSSVAAGEPVLLLDNDKALKKLAQAESDLAFQESEYKQAVMNKALWQQKLDEARKNLQRLQRLYDVGNLSFNELENAYLEIATFEKHTLGIDLKSLEVQLQKKRLAVKTARDVLSATVITSPFSGTLFKVGVTEDQSVTAGVHLFTVGDPETIEAFCLADMEDAVKIKEGQPVELSGEGLKGKKLKGHVLKDPLSREENIGIDPENKVKVRIALDEKLKTIGPGGINISILTELRNNVLVVPLNAVLERGGKNIVFVYSEGMARVREIEKGLSDGQYQEITSGLSADEIVITSSLDSLTDQTKLKIK